jgi:hypothetical protein
MFQLYISERQGKFLQQEFNNLLSSPDLIAHIGTNKTIDDSHTNAIICNFKF